jgi:uncharacterized protein YecE (DUF72 family)
LRQRFFHPATSSIIRLLGPDRPGIEKETGGEWNQIVEPKDEGLETTADIVRQNVASDLDTYVNVNNHYEGSGALTIQRVLDLLRQHSFPSLAAPA